jgi:hypothetical protein
MRICVVTLCPTTLFLTFLLVERVAVFLFPLLQEYLQAVGKLLVLPLPPSSGIRRNQHC